MKEKRKLTAKSKIAELSKTKRIVPIEYVDSFSRENKVQVEYVRQLLRDYNISVLKSNADMPGGSGIEASVLRSTDDELLIEGSIAEYDFNYSKNNGQIMDKQESANYDTLGVSKDGFSGAYATEAMPEEDLIYLKPFVVDYEAAEYSIKDTIGV